jgi:hypothetical protein
MPGKHALLSPSAAERWLACPPSARLAENLPDRAGTDADTGTLAHKIAELKLRKHYVGMGPKKYKDALTKLQQHDLYDSEMDRYTDEYLDYVKGITMAQTGKCAVLIEQRVTMDKYVPECSGTCDCVVLYGDKMWVVDFKYGKGVTVDAEQNPQIMLYALGALDALEFVYPIEVVGMTIFQPRQADGVREWSQTAAELESWGQGIRETAKLAFDGRGNFAPSPETCRWCRAKNMCRARAEANANLIGTEQNNMKELLSDEEVGVYLTRGKAFVEWYNDLREYAESQALAGRAITGWKLVEGRSTREWTDEKAAFSAAIGSGVEESLLYERRPLSLAKVETLMGKKQFGETLGGFVNRPRGAPTLVPESDKRDVYKNTPSAAEVFTE